MKADSLVNESLGTHPKNT